MHITQLSYVQPPVALPVTREQLMEWGIPSDDIDKGKSRGNLQTIGPWQIPLSYRALAVSARWDSSKGYTTVKSKTVFGVRSLSACRQEGYCLEGRVSVNGKTYRGFSSSQLFELPEGKLIDVAIVFVCAFNM